MLITVKSCSTSKVILGKYCCIQLGFSIRFSIDDQPTSTGTCSERSAKARLEVVKFSVNHLQLDSLFQNKYAKILILLVF